MAVDHEKIERHLLDSAAEVLCRDSGASLAQVASAAGVSRTTLHRHFATRQDLLRALAHDALDRVAAAVDGSVLAEGPAAEVLTAVAAAVLPLADELRFLDLGASVWNLPELIERWYDLAEPLEAVIRKGQRDGALRADQPPAWIVDVFTSTVWAASDGIRDGRIARRDAVGLIVDTVLNGTVARK